MGKHVFPRTLFKENNLTISGGDMGLGTINASLGGVSGYLRAPVSQWGMHPPQLLPIPAFSLVSKSMSSNTSRTISLKDC